MRNKCYKINVKIHKGKVCFFLIHCSLLHQTLSQQDNLQVASVNILLQHKPKKSNKQHEGKFQRNY